MGRARILTRYARWVAHRLTRRSPVVRLAPWDVRLRLPVDWPVGTAMIYVMRGAYEPELRVLAEVLGKDGVFIDAGASIGIYSCVAGAIVGPGGAGYALEPGEGAFDALLENLSLNRLSHVHPIRCAASDYDGEGRLFKGDLGPTGYSLYDIGGIRTEFDPVEVLTLDRLARERGISRVDFLKLDVEGSERAALEGALGIVDRHRPVILLEIVAHPSIPESRRDSAEAWELLVSKGYGFRRVDADGKMLRVDSIPDYRSNVIAVPEA